MHIIIIGLTNGHATVTPVGNAPFRSSPGLVNSVPRLADHSRNNEFFTARCYAVMRLQS